MAISKCVKCNSTSFEVKTMDVGAKFKIAFVQCSSCGGVVGVLEATNVGYLVRQLAKEQGIVLDE